MKPEKKLQKNIYYSSAGIKELIENRLQDLSATQRRPHSAIMEDALISYLYPYPEDVSCFITDMYHNGYGINKTLHGLFQGNINGLIDVYRSAFHDIVLFFKTIQQEHGLMSVPQKNNSGFNVVPHLKNQLDSIQQRLQNRAKTSLDPERRRMYETGAAHCAVLIESITDEGMCLNIISCLDIILDFWEDLKEWAPTYRFLMDLTVLCPCCDLNHDGSLNLDYSQQRQELCDLILRLYEKEEKNYGA